MRSNAASVCTVSSVNRTQTEQVYQLVMLKMPTANAPTCVSWLLLATYAVLLGIGGLGVWVTFNNFTLDEPVGPTPPPLKSISTTTTTPAPYRRYYNGGEKIPQAYKDYVEKSQVFSRISNDAKIYLGPPCIVCVMVAAIILVVGLCSRQLFISTFSLYSTLGLWVATLTFTILYQNMIIPMNEGPFSENTFAWILGIHVLLLLLLSVQILLCMWELRRQEVRVWPTINLISVFTLEAALLAARLTLLVYIFASLPDSQMLRGLWEKVNLYKDYYEYYNGPRVRYPPALAIVCCATVLYSAVATMETILSVLLGKLHGCMTSLTCLLSAVCVATTAVLSSPVFIRIFIGPYGIWPITMNLSISLSVVTFLHMLACLFIPNTLRSPPSILTYVITKLSDISTLGITMNMFEQRMKMALAWKKKRSMFYINLASAVFSITSIILVATSFRGYEVWGHVMVISANVATLVRTLPAVVMELIHEWSETVLVKQKTMTLALESTVMLVGAIGLCILSWNGLGIFAGVINIFFSVFQGCIIFGMIKGILLEAPQPEETQHLAEAEEVNSQCTDNQQNSIDCVA